jgi:sarcosine oxidase
VVVTCDTLVVGLGATGSAAAWQLAKRGLQVVALEQHAPGHVYGSSHGRTRIIREAYFEHPLYVPLVHRAFELWHALEQASGSRLLVRTGGLTIGAEDGAVFRGALRSVREHGLPHEVLSARDLRRRFPVLAPADDMAAVLEARAGALMVEDCVAALQEAARGHGATMRHGEAALAWRPVGSGAAVVTTAGEYHAGAVLICAGPWLPRLCADLALPLWVERQLSHWFEPQGDAAAFGTSRCPVTVWEHAPDRCFYTIPDPGGHGFKAGVHHEGERVDPDTVDRTPRAADEAQIRALLERFIPQANGRLLDARVCLYTNTPDEHFLIDRHPESGRVLLASPCSGHGFKFATAIGEALADLVTEGRSRFDLSPFALSRLRQPPG